MSADDPRKLELAIDGLAERFGTNVVCRADDLKKPPGTRFTPTLDFLDDRTLDWMLAASPNCFHGLLKSNGLAVT